MIEPEFYSNPVVPGFHPDPTICRVGEDYYLAVSSFTYFPGIPLFHSRDLVHWRPIGHVLTRASQFPPAPQTHSQGIYAPTLRHDGRRFWVISTNVGNGGNFICTADQIEGPWSDPVYLEDAPGIDPSLYFDNDGRVWVTGTAEVPEGGRYFGDNEIWLRQLDPENLGWKGPRTGLWRGALRDVVWPEGPHIHKRDGWYYLMISEAGTGFHHAVTVARSRAIDGPYVGHRANPILTHRHLGADYPITNVGHPDLVQTPTGEWWMVVLGSRPFPGGGTTRGRETFLVPLVWEGDWPVVNPGSGRVESQHRRPNLPWCPWPGTGMLDGFDSFDGESLGPRWQYLRSPSQPVVDLNSRPGWLRLLGTTEAPGTLGTQAWIGRTVDHGRWQVRTRIEGAGPVSCGLCVIQSDEYLIRLEVRHGSSPGASVIVRSKAQDRVVADVSFGPRLPLPGFWELGAEKLRLWCRYSIDGSRWVPLDEDIDGTILTTEAAGGFVGCMVGPYAVAGSVDFDWFDYRGES